MTTNKDLDWQKDKEKHSNHEPQNDKDGEKGIRRRKRNINASAEETQMCN